ncbi:hypothetical protein HDV03_001924 [Kappamyces sp. JEL0829]|nr:hypothetical protein HDV03_001924 [Kappamyces sp. JEL0829]
MGFNVSAFQFAQNLPINYTNGEFPFPLEQIDAVSTDAIVFLTIYPFRTWFVVPASHCRGSWNVTDQDIDFLAQQCKNMTKREWNPLRVMLRFGPEMNGNWMPYGMQPLKFVSLWKRVYTAVKAVAPDVVFVWSPNCLCCSGLTLVSPGYPFGSQSGNVGPGKIPLPADELAALDTNNNTRLDAGDSAYSPFYPGAEYVDWVGLSFYWKGDNTLPPAGQYESYTNAGNFYQTYAVKQDKPMVVSEGGAVFFSDQPAGPGEVAIKQAWWRQSITSGAFLDKYSQLKMFGLFEFKKAEDSSAFLSTSPLSDFRISNNTEVLNAFKTDFANVTSRYLLAQYVAPPPPSVSPVSPPAPGQSPKQGSATSVRSMGTAALASLALFYLC